MTNTAKKVTKDNRFEDIIALLNGESVKYGTSLEDAMNFITHERELLARKNNPNKEKKPTQTQVENAEYKELIKDFLFLQAEGVTVTTLIKSIPQLSDFSTPKVSRLVKDLVDEGKVVRNIVKGKSLFTLA